MISSSSSKETNPRLSPKLSSCYWAPFPPQAESLDKGHGVIVQRRLWAMEVDAQTMGIPAAMQIFRIDRKVETLRKGKVIKTTTETAYGVTSRLPDEASPQQLNSASEIWLNRFGCRSRQIVPDPPPMGESRCYEIGCR